MEHRAFGETYRMPTPQFPRLHAGRGESRGCRMYAPRVAPTFSSDPRQPERRPYREGEACAHAV